MNLSTLIKEAKQGSAAAQKCLFDQLSDKLMIVCRLYVKNQQDAEELLQDGFYKFFKNLHAFNYQSDAALYASTFPADHLKKLTTTIKIKTDRVAKKSPP